MAPGGLPDLTVLRLAVGEKGAPAQGIRPRPGSVDPMRTAPPDCVSGTDIASLVC